MFFLNLPAKPPAATKSTVCRLVISAIVERDVGARCAGSGAVSVTIPGLVDGSMAGGKGAAKQASLWDNMRIRFIVCFIGVFVCYFYYGILQETM